MIPSDMSALLNDVIAPQIIGKLVGNMEILQLASVWPNPQQAGTGGNLYRVPKLSDGGANTRAPGATTTASAVTSSQVDITVTEYYESRFFDRDTLQVLTNEQILFQAGLMLNNVIEKANVDAFAAITATAGIGSFGTVGTAVDRSTMLLARAYFHNNKIGADRQLIISEETRQDLFADADYKPAFQYSSAIVNGGLPNIESFNVSTSVYTEAVTGPPAGHNNLAFDPASVVNIFPDAAAGMEGRSSMLIGRAEKDGVNVVVGWEDVPNTNGGAQLNVWMLHGVGVIRPEGVAVIAGN